MPEQHLRLTDEQASQLQTLADTEHRSVQGQILAMIDEALATRGKIIKADARRARATRLPEDFTVTPEMILWARENTPNVGRRETENFIDYWRSAAGVTARKLDWVAAWRTWMRKAEAQVTGGGVLKSREQRETDAMFDRMYERAVKMEQQQDEANRDGRVDQVRPRALPSAED